MESDEIKRKRMEKFLKKKENLDNFRSNFNEEPSPSTNVASSVKNTSTSMNQTLEKNTNFEKPSSSSSNKNFISIFKQNQNIEKSISIWQAIKSIFLIALVFLILFNCK